MFYRLGMPEADKLTPAGPSDLADALAFALRLHGRKRVQNADEIMAEIVAKACEAAILKEGHFLGFTNQGKHDSR